MTVRGHVPLTGAPDGELTAHTAPTDKVTETFAPVALNRNGDGSWEVSFPVELSGWIRFKDLKAQKGDTIDVKYHCDQPLGVHRYIAGKDGKVNHAPVSHGMCSRKQQSKGWKTSHRRTLLRKL